MIIGVKISHDESLMVLRELVELHSLGALLLELARGYRMSAKRASDAVAQNTELAVRLENFVATDISKEFPSDQA